MPQAPPNLHKFAGAHATDDVLIVGTGPSRETLNRDWANSVVTMVLNHSPDWLQPTYWLCRDAIGGNLWDAIRPRLKARGDTKLIVNSNHSAHYADLKPDIYYNTRAHDNNPCVVVANGLALNFALAIVKHLGAKTIWLAGIDGGPMGEDAPHAVDCAGLYTDTRAKTRERSYNQYKSVLDQMKGISVWNLNPDAQWLDLWPHRRPCLSSE